MVELGVATCVFGDAPDPAKDPPYPGVSATRFDPSGALAAYREALRKEKNCNVNGQRLRAKLDEIRGLPPKIHDRLGDIMPNRGSITTTYERLGYHFHPVTGLPVPPAHTDPPLPQPLPQGRQTPSALGKRAPEASVSQASAPGPKLKAEAHTRLALLEAWEEHLQTMNSRSSRGNSASSSAPNLNALWGSARSSGQDGEASCLSAAATESLLDGHRSTVSRSTAFGRSGSVVSAARPFGLKGERSGKKSTWYFDSRRGPSLLPPGVRPSGVATCHG